MDYNYHFFGMDLIWWAIWLAVLISYFSFFAPVLKKNIKNSPLDILPRRFSTGEISVQDYEQRKRFIEKDCDLRVRMFLMSTFSRI